MTLVTVAPKCQVVIHKDVREVLSMRQPKNIKPWCGLKMQDLGG